MNKFKIAVLPGDGIGKEITRPSMDFVTEVAAAYGVVLDAEYLDAGAELYSKTGDAFPEECFDAAANADAIYLCAMGLPTVRYPDGTEVGPQHTLRKRLKLYAGVRPCITMPNLPLPLKDERAKNLDFVIVRESIEGIFAAPLKTQLDNEEAAFNCIRISREISKKLFKYSFELAQKRKAQGKPGKVTCIDKANVLSSMYFFRRIFDEVKGLYPDIAAGYSYVDAAALSLVIKPWDFDVCPTENLCGDILSDLAAGLMGGMGMAPSGEIGDNNAVFQPCHGSAPDIVGTGKANPTGMVLSGAMMLEYLADKYQCKEALSAAEKINSTVRTAYETGTILPYELGGDAGYNKIFSAFKDCLNK